MQNIVNKNDSNYSDSWERKKQSIMTLKRSIYSANNEIIREWNFFWQINIVQMGAFGKTTISIYIEQNK
ncbi:MAG: hypothetical protein LBG80_20845 [Bacteroidales bacterium]|jgi:hypothetical protein|nr:hypothetical protein [Bacteroidales bacterium]